MPNISQFKDRKTDTLYNIKDALARAVKEDINRLDNTDGMAKIVIKKSASFASQLIQGKTTYIIRNNFDLDGAEVSIPAECVLKFEGGSIGNGTLVGNHTHIEASKGTCIFKEGMLINGTWDVDKAYSSWFSCSKDGYEIEYVNINSTKVVANASTKIRATTTTYTILGESRWPTPKDNNNAGNGTKENPYTIAQAIASGSGEFYMKFYPMGICNGETLTSNTFVACTDGILDMIDSHVVIVDAYNGTKYILLLDNAYVKSNINLKDNYAYSAQPMVAKVKATEDTFGVKAFQCATLGYFEKYLNNTKVIGEEVSDPTISTNSDTTTSESKYKVVDDDTSYTAGTLPSATFTSDTVPLQQLLNIKALHTIIEEGVYMIDTSGSRNIGLLVTEAKSSRLTIDGTLKAIPTESNRGYRVLALEGCTEFLIDGKGKIQGDLPEHSGNVENGMCIAISSVYVLTVEGISLEYPMCDCAYVHWRTGGTTFNSNNQKNHFWKNVRFLNGRRTGLVYERGDDVTVDRCQFLYCGRFRGISTFSAVDIEPFGQWDSTKRYVENYKFTGNNFIGNRNGLRIERCANTLISNNMFRDNTDASIIIMENYLTNQSVDRNMWMASYQLNTCEVNNNYIYGGETAISFESISKPATAYVHDNIVVSTSSEFLKYINLKNSKICRNSVYDTKLLSYGSGSSNYLTDVEISDNNITRTIGGYQSGSVFGDITHSTYKNVKIVRNEVLGLTSETYNGIGNYGFGKKGEAVSPNIIKITAQSSELVMENNKIKDEYLWYNENSPRTNSNVGIINGIRTVNENNGLFLAGDLIESQYGQKGLVTKSGTIAGVYGIPFTAGMMLYTGEVITNGSVYNIISTGGKAGDTWADRFVNGAAAFKSQNFAAPEIKWLTTGQCTSETRPTMLNTKGRKLVETDTNLLIEYDGTRYVVINNGYRGTTAQRPALTTYDEGVEYYDTTTRQQLRWTGTEWISTSSVPVGDITDVPNGGTGDMFYLTPDNKPIWCVNGVWKFADGTTVPTDINFADTTILKPLCVSLADTNKDGEVSYAEAKALTDIGTTFKNAAFTSFDEFQYFTGVTQLKANAFSGCNAMTSLTIPASVTNISPSAIYTTGATYTITILATTPPSGGYPFNGTNKPTKIYVPDDSVAAYKSHSIWGNYSTIIKPLSEKV